MPPPVTELAPPAHMDVESAALTLDQLGNLTRLKIVRLLVKAGNDGLAVGEIQRALEIPASTLSHHLQHLKSAGLVGQTRHATTLRCRVNYSRIEALVDFLTAECCVGVDVS